MVQLLKMQSLSPIILAALFYIVSKILLLAFYIPGTPLPCYGVGDCTPPTIDVIIALGFTIAYTLSIIVIVRAFGAAQSLPVRLFLSSLFAILAGKGIEFAYRFPYSPLPCYSDIAQRDDCTGPGADILVMTTYIAAVVLLVLATISLISTKVAKRSGRIHKGK